MASSNDASLLEAEIAASARSRSEADFRSQKRISREEASKLIWRLKEHANLSYESETTIAAQIGVDEGSLNRWLAGRVKPTFRSLLKVREFLGRQVETRGGIAPIGYVPIRGNNPNGRRGGWGEVRSERRLVTSRSEA